MTITWYIKPISTPTVLRNCSHCGSLSEFICSHKFRINAQQKKLDVWLIYNCKKCGCSWNMCILERVKPEYIDRHLYDGFLDNNLELSLKYAFDTELLSRNKVRVSNDDVLYDVEGDAFSLELLEKETVTLQIKSPYNIQIRLDKLLSEKLGISRSLLASCLRLKAITSTDFGFNPEKPKNILKGDMTLQFSQQVVHILDSSLIG